MVRISASRSANLKLTHIKKLSAVMHYEELFYSAQHENDQKPFTCRL